MLYPCKKVGMCVSDMHLKGFGSPSEQGHCICMNNNKSTQVGDFGFFSTNAYWWSHDCLGMYIPITPTPTQH